MGHLLTRRGGWLDWRAMRARAAAALEALEVAIDLDAPLGALSVARKHRVSIARALTHDARVLILDEPTAAQRLRPRHPLPRGPPGALHDRPRLPGRRRGDGGVLAVGLRSRHFERLARHARVAHHGSWASLVHGRGASRPRRNETPGRYLCTGCKIREAIRDGGVDRSISPERH